MVNEHIEKILFYHAVIKANNYLWVSALNHNGLYRVSLDFKKVSFMGLFPREKANAKFLHSSVCLFNNKLYFIPFEAQNLSTYDLVTHAFESYRIETKGTDEHSSFYAGYSMNKKIVLIPCRHRYMLVFDPCKECFESFGLIREIKDNRGLPFALGGCIYENAILLGSNIQDIVYEYMLEEKRVNKIRLPYVLNGISNIISDNDKRTIWIIGKNGQIIEWNKKHNTYKKHFIKMDNRERHYGVIFSAMYFQGKIYMSSTDDNLLYIFDTSLREKAELHLGKEIVSEGQMRFPMKLLNLYCVDKKIRLLRADCGKTYELDTQNGELMVYPSVTLYNIDYKTYADEIGLKCDGDLYRDMFILDSFIKQLKDSNGR